MTALVEPFPTITIDRTRQLAHFPEGRPLMESVGDYLRKTETAVAGRPVAGAITAIVPVYNTDPAMLHVALDSLLAQIWRPAYILVIDDGSDRPDTQAYLAAIADSPLIHVLRNPRNLSLGPTMNRALDACPTPFALKLDSDDVADPGLVAAYCDHLDARPTPDVLGCQFTAFGESHFTTRHPSRVTRNHVVRSPGYWFMNHTGVLLNRDSLQAVGGYRAMRGLPEDYDLWIRMMRAGYYRFVNLDQSLVAYRDSPAALHRNFRRGIGRLRLMAAKASARLLPPF
ncbi:glycosyltransferase [Chelatococcus asaccharovorans]|uniref:glycosyltransferase n=1 Tax=Chelatococcus asaccharovorans TaxID=28210 RepID=UPI00224C6C3B|nr:glycosyltransferase [Chelatococcus asaccharovorans]CAH1668095.1 Glycosyltransferase involved in cell wall biosynthesis [Chelatococcus asaccharovorans]CAH1680392.1 Glycosyltransferase involved in cell wall biosynthesis [Chelatococcus asaccharovorans]